VKLTLCVRCFGLERDVANFVDHKTGVSAEADEFVLEPACLVGGGEPVDPLGRGGEQDAVPGLAGPDRQSGGEMGSPGFLGAEEDHVLPGR
jgi:hypothetical protein